MLAGLSLSYDWFQKGSPVVVGEAGWFLLGWSELQNLQVSSSAPHSPTAFFSVPKGSKPRALCVGLMQCLCCCCSSAGGSSLLLLVWFAAAVRDLEQAVAAPVAAETPKSQGCHYLQGFRSVEVCLTWPCLPNLHTLAYVCCSELGCLRILSWQKYSCWGLLRAGELSRGRGSLNTLGVDAVPAWGKLQTWSERAEAVHRCSVSLGSDIAVLCLEICTRAASQL